MAIIIGITGLVMGVAGIIIGWVALTKVQTLSVEFVKAHIQGLRTESAKNSAAINSLTTKLALLEKNKSNADAATGEEHIGKTPPPQASTH